LLFRVRACLAEQVYKVLLRTGEEFDLTIALHRRVNGERIRILPYANEMPTYKSLGLTLAAELLVQVERLLAPAG
jgi:hypothetical protein